MHSYIFDNIHLTVNEVDKHSLYIEYTYQQMVLVSTSSLRKEENIPSIKFYSSKGGNSNKNSSHGRYFISPSILCELIKKNLYSKMQFTNISLQTTAAISLQITVSKFINITIYVQKIRIMISGFWRKVTFALFYGNYGFACVQVCQRKARVLGLWGERMMIGSFSYDQIVKFCRELS